MKIYSKYKNGQEFCWFDSTNTIFCKCYDNPGGLKVLKIVFKGGRTYLYRDVDINDYITFRDSESNGTAFYKHIKKYSCVRIQDTDLDKLEEMKTKFIEDEQDIDNSKMSDLGYVIDYCDKTGEFILKINGKTIYSGVEGQVSIVKLFLSMGIKCSLNSVDKIDIETDDNSDKINTEE